VSYRADPDFLLELKKYGEVNIESCFNCGNCTAVCPLSTEDVNFPRRMIRLAQLGLPDKLLSSEELWLCYYCGECTQTCPRQADPGEFMATARRYAIARYDHSGLARLLYTSPVLSTIFLVVLALVLALFMYTAHGPMPSDSLRLFEFIPAETIHNLGLAVMAIVALAGFAGAATMVIRINRVNGLIGRRGIRLNWLGALWETLGLEVLGQTRYRKTCETTQAGPAWYRQPWFIHASIMGGFLGLLAATTLDYGLDLMGIKATGVWVPLWYPVRLLGTVAGLFLVYGTSVAIVKRLWKYDESSTHSVPSDWVFLNLLWLSGVSGFGLEIALYLPYAPAWGYWLLLFHVAVAMELLLLAPFTKFAHAFYRPLALYIHALKPLPQTELAEAAGPN
jgi:ferredoxin